MDHLNPETCLGQEFFYLFTNQNRAMLSAGAAKTNGEITFAFAHIVRDQVGQ